MSKNTTLSCLPRKQKERKKLETGKKKIAFKWQNKFRSFML